MALLSSLLTIFSLFAITLSVYNTISLPSLCSTLFILSSPIPILAYTRVDLIGPYLILVFIASLGCVVWSPHFQTPRNLINRIFEYRPKFPLILIAAAFISFLTLYNFMPGRWFYEGHDIVYYGWINEVFKNDYTGPIRVSTAFPLELSANHLLATSILVPFQALSTHISIQSSLTVKYFFTFTVLTGFFYSYIVASTSVCSVLFGQHRTPNKLYLKKYFQISQIIAIPLLMAYLYGWAEFDYNNSISSYSSLALLLLLAINVFERIFAHCQSNSRSDPQHEEDTKSRLESRSITLVTLVALFCFSKATLFPVAIFAALAYVLDSLLAKGSNIKLKFIQFANYVTRLNGADRIPVLLLLCSLVMSFTGWVIKPSQHGTIALSFPLCLATDSVKIKTCLMSSLLNPFSGWDLLDENPPKVQHYKVSSGRYRQLPLYLGLDHITNLHTLLASNQEHKCHCS